MSSGAQPPVALPRPLATWKVALSSILLPICIIGIATAATGLFVLTDRERTSWIAQSRFGEIWRDLVIWNPMISNLLFNGGLLGAILCFATLRKHRQGMLLKNVRILSNKEIADARKQAEPKKRR